MVGSVIQDHTIKLGFDGSDVFKGIQDVQRRLRNIKVPKINLGATSIGGASTVRASGGSFGGLGNLEDRRKNLQTDVDVYQANLKRILGGNNALFTDLKSRFRGLRSSIQSATNPDAMKELKRELRRLRIVGANTVRSFRNLERAGRDFERVSDSLGNSLVNLAASYLSVFTIIEAGQAIFRAGKEMDSLKASMLATASSSEEAGDNFQFVREQAKRLGVDLTEAARGYAKIGAVSKTMNLETSETRDIFLAASEASRTFGLNAERTKLVMLGFSQALSKGKISSQELRLQIGEQIPIALQAAEKALGVTTEEFNKMLEGGKILSKDFMPKFAKQLRSMVKENGALAASMQKVEAVQTRMRNEFVEMSEAIFKAGGAALLKGTFDALADILQVVKALFQGIGFIITSVVEAFKPLTDVLTDATGGFNAISFMVKVLIGLLIQGLVPAIATTGVAGSRAAVGMMSFAGAMRAAATTARALGRALGFGLALEGIGLVLDKFVYNGQGSSSSGSNTNSGNTTTNTNNITLEINGTANSEETAQMTIDMLTEQQNAISFNGDL